MLGRLIPVKKDLLFERTYPVPREAVWQAWTDADRVRQWWGPEKTLIPECEVDARVGGQFRVVMEAGEDMGKYRGTRWPMVGTITALEPPARLVVEARSWTEGSEAETTIHHTNTLTLADAASGGTAMTLRVTITAIGPGARLAAFGMKWGYRQQFDKLAALLSPAAT